MSELTTPVRSDSSRHAISVLIVTAAILWNLAGITRKSAIGDPNAVWSLWELGVFTGLAYAQVMLAAGYLVWGKLNVAIRAAVLALVVIASSLLVPTIHDHSFQLGLTAFLRTALAIAFVLAGLHLMGLRLAHPELSSPSRLRWQFSLRQILSVTTAAAILLCVARWNIITDDDGWWAFAYWYLPQSAIGVVCLTTPLAFKRWWWSVCVGGASSFLVGYWLSARAESRNIFIMVITQWFLVVGCCTVMRLAGYRLAWHRLTRANQPTSSAPPHTTAHPGT